MDRWMDGMGDGQMSGWLQTALTGWMNRWTNSLMDEQEHRKRGKIRP